MFAVNKDTMRQADLKKLQNYYGKLDVSIGSVENATIDLMRIVADALYKHAQKFCNILIVCGGGNNGGDGYALALKFKKHDKKVTVLQSHIPTTSPAKHFFRLCKEQGVDVTDKLPNSISEFDCVIDCMYGIGFHGAIPEKDAEIIAKINASNSFKIACDIPSGLNADNGIADKNCFRADFTVALGAHKLGYYLNDGKDFCGDIALENIGISDFEDKIAIIDNNCLKTVFAKRKNNCHKGTYGNLIIVANSHNYVGAGLLSYVSAVNVMGECALRTGCGYCRLCAPGDMISALQSHAVHCCLLSHKDLFNVKATAIAVGMGLGDENCLMVKNLVSNSSAKLLIDATALAILADNLDWLNQKSCDILLTPHVGEFAKLCKVSVAEVLQNPLDLAKKFALQYGVIIYLKGVSSLITDGKRTAILIDGTPSLAKGGSGDVLSGVIAGIMARHDDIFESAIAGGYLCAIATKSLNLNQYAVMPMDIAQAITKFLDVN